MAIDSENPNFYTKQEFLDHMGLVDPSKATFPPGVSPNYRKDKDSLDPRSIDTYDPGVESLLDLPDALLIKIFDDFCPEFLMRTGSSICERLHEISVLPTLHSRVHVRSFLRTLDDDLFLEYLEECPLVETLKVSDTNITVELLERIGRMTCLEHLHIENCIFDSVDKSVIAPILPKLKSFYLDCDMFETEITESFKKECGNNNKYQWLSDLSGLEHVSIKSRKNDMTANLHALLRNRDLKTLHLNLNSLNLIDVLGDRQINTSHLSSLACNAKDLTANGISQTVFCLVMLKNLKSLEVEWRQGSCHRKAADLVEALGQLVRLESLKLKHCVPGENGLKELFAKLVNLRRIDLEACSLTGKTLIQLADSAENLSEFRVMNCYKLTNYDVEDFVCNASNLRIFTLQAEWFLVFSKKVVSQIENKLEQLIIEKVHNPRNAFKLHRKFSGSKLVKTNVYYCL